MLVRGLLQVVDPHHAELLVDELDFLRSQAGDLQQLDEASGDSGLEVFEVLHPANLQVLVYPRRQGFADALYLLQPALRAERFDVKAQAFDAPRSLTVSADPESALALDLEQVRYVTQQLGNFFISHVSFKDLTIKHALHRATETPRVSQSSLRISMPQYRISRSIHESLLMRR